MITQEIAFHAPRSLSEALDLVQRYEGEAKVIGGGMSLVPAMNLGVARPTTLISLNHVTELVGIEVEGDHLRVRAGTTHVDIHRHPAVRQEATALAEAAERIGDVQVRNRGTIGGSVAHADPAANYLPTLVVLGAHIVTRSARGERAMPAEEFFVDILTTALEPDEIIVAILVPRPTGVSSAYRHLSRIEGSFPIVSTASVLAGTLLRVAVGGVAGRPVMVEQTVPAPGKVDDAALDALADAVRAACVEPLSDLHASAEYRREMAGIFARRAAHAAAS